MRRLLTILLIAAGLSLVGRGVVPCAALVVQPRCYVSLHPGPTANTLEIIAVPGERAYASTGELVLTTVAVDSELDLGEWLRAIFSAQVQQVPRSILYPPGVAEEEVRRRNVADMDRSQLVAAAAALRELGYEVGLDPQGAEVVEVRPGAPADGQLEPGDVVVAVDGDEVLTAVEAADALTAHAPGEDVTLEVRSGDGTRTVRLTSAQDEDGSATVGALLADHVPLPVEVQVDAGDIAGPSAGLMFALTVIELLGPEDLTGGRVIAGTGGIDLDGNVSSIGGIRQKILGAQERGEERAATVFLVPADNVAEARGAPVEDDILIVPVATLGDALDALSELRAGRQPADAFALGGG